MNTLYKRGFTLVELMIVVVVIGIIASIAYPNYQDYLKRTNRLEAQTSLQGIANKLVTYKVSHGNFKTVASANLFDTKVPSTGTSNYTIKIEDLDGNALMANNAKVYTWKLTAIPENKMAGTGNLTLDSTGRQCWEKTAGACEPWEGK